MTDTIAMIGFGEAGATFARAGGWEASARVFDRKTDTDDAAAMRDRYADAGVEGAATLAAALAGRPLVLSLVTADQALAAAEAAAPHLASGALYCDGNSVAPQTKQAAARTIEAAGGHYVDLAILSPVDPARLAAPLLVSGARAEAAAAMLAALGFQNISTAGDAVGRASSIKMIRSVMVKGIEALTAECLLAAETAGVRDAVLASLDASERARPWEARADYNLDRMMIHGLRRAAEMEEVIKTLEALGTGAEMTRGTVARQRAIGALGLGTPPDGLAPKLAAIEERISRA
ncbi:DUF1932 domain-containing protein [Sphingomonas sp. RS6]